MMSEDSHFLKWIDGRRNETPRVEENFSAGVMGRILELEAVPTIGEKVFAMIDRLVPERRREVVYFGGSAFAGALRVFIILYFVLGTF